MSFQDKEKSLTQSKPYELHAFWQGDYQFPYYPVLRTITAQSDPGLSHAIPISGVDDLQAMKNNLSGNYYLTCDIDASETQDWNGGLGFEPIGTFFTGSLDGCGYTIKNLYIQRPSTNFIGLFEYLRSGAKIANLSLLNIHYLAESYIGALASDISINGSDDILIQNVRATGTIEGDPNKKDMQYCGGLLGRCYFSSGTGTIYVYDSSADVTIDMTNAVRNCRGGFVGRADDCLVFHNCYATGSLINPTDDIAESFGGFAGYLEKVSCSYCYATGNVEGGLNGSAVGGFVGGMRDCSIEKCYATGDVSGIYYIGGFCGFSDSLTVGTAYENCYAWGNATGYQTVACYTGGFVGTEADLRNSYLNCYSKGLVTGDGAGGFAGSSDIAATFTNCYWDTETSGQSASEGDAIGKTTQQMYNRLIYVGWDFDLIWAASNLVENSSLWLYADAPSDVKYNGMTYKACYITGDKIEAGTTAVKCRTVVKTNWNNPFTWQYTTAIPGNVIHYKRFRGQGEDVKLIYVGDVLAVEFKQTSRKGDRYAEITIEPPRAQLGQMGLISRYSRQCTVELYSLQCGANPALFIKSGTLDSYSGNVLTSTTFGTESDGYWSGGEIFLNSIPSRIIDHSGNDITILPYRYDISAGDSFDVYPGCDHLSTTCNTKFSNLANYKGQPNIPLKNIFDEEAMFS